MATVTVKMLATSGQTLTLDVFPLDSDTATDSQSSTEATNRKQLYSTNVTLTNAGIYTAHMKTTAGSTPMGSGYFAFNGVDLEIVRVGSYWDALAQLEAGEPAQGALPVAESLIGKVAYLFKLQRNRKRQNNSGDLEFYADDDVTIDHKATSTDDGSNFDRSKVAGP